jgi:hypothetical protein
MAKKNKKPQVMRLMPEKVTELISKLEVSNVDNEVTEVFKILINENEWFCDQLEKGLLTIAKLRKLFQIQGSEKAVNRNPHHNKRNDSNDTDSNSEKEKPKGHGRNGADAYAGAEIINVPHPELKPGDDCPAEFCTGKLYEMADSGIFIKVTLKLLERHLLRLLAMSYKNYVVRYVE